MAGLDQAIHYRQPICEGLIIYHIINVLAASFSFRGDGRVKPGHDEKPKDGRRKGINNS